MIKSSMKIITAGMIGGLLSFGLTSTFKPDIPLQISKTNNQPNWAERQNENISQGNYATPVMMPVIESDVSFTTAAEKTINSVVHITTQYEMVSRRDPFSELFYGDGTSTQIATGSGVIISDDGYIVTNNHVVDGADKIEITLNNERTYTAAVIGKDPNTDLALLKINEKKLPFINFGNSDDVKIGEWVLAVGNPFNLTSTVTAGIISAKARNINILQRGSGSKDFPLESFIQTDAAVNPGNSGGALVSATGNLIGINTAIASQTGSYTGYSFAIPSNIVKKVTEDLLEYGIVQRAFIGVSIQNVNQQVANDYKLPNLKGVMVNGITEDGAAKSAGIQVNDVILKVGSIEVNDVPELQEQIGSFRPGEKASITIRRGSEIKSLTIVLRNKEGSTAKVRKEDISKLTVHGASFKGLSPQELKDLKINSGVKIYSITSGKLRNAGITDGFIITKIDKQAVTDPETAVKLFKSKKGGILVEGIYPNGAKGYFGFGL
jgi:serine protease Do